MMPTWCMNSRRADRKSSITLVFKHTFSVECPYGTENERAVRFALERYQLARNRMPDAFVEDIDRFSDTDPASSEKAVCSLATWRADRNVDGRDEIVGRRHRIS